MLPTNTTSEVEFIDPQQHPFKVLQGMIMSNKTSQSKTDTKITFYDYNKYVAQQSRHRRDTLACQQLERRTTAEMSLMSANIRYDRTRSQLSSPI